MDIQLVLDEYAVASYMLNYFVKSDVGLTKMLQQIAQEKDHINIKIKLQKISNAFINSSIMSSQEAVYHLMQLPLSYMSPSNYLINT